MIIPLSPYVPDNLVSRDGFSRPVPRQPAHLHTQAEYGAYSRYSSRFPQRRPFIFGRSFRREIASSELRPRRSSGVCLAYTSPSGQRQRPPGSVYLTEILPATDSDLRLRRSSSGVRLAYTDLPGERQRAPSTPQQWGPPSLHRSFRRATASTVHAAVGSV